MAASSAGLMMLALVGCGEDWMKSALPKIDDSIEFFLSEGNDTLDISSTRTIESVKLISENNQDTLSLYVTIADRDSLPDTLFTRGVCVTTDKLKNAYDNNIGVRSFVESEFYFENLLKYEESHKWATPVIYYWPNSTVGLDFWAWAPKNIPDGKGSIEEIDNVNQSMIFTYTMPAPNTTVNKDAENQLDLILSHSKVKKTDHDGRVPLNFKHALAAIRFEIGKTSDIIVKSISLKNIKSKGQCTYAPNESTSVIWSSLTNPATFKHTFDTRIDVQNTYDAIQTQPVDASENQEATFMVIPQQSQAGSEIEIEMVYQTIGSDKDITVSHKMTSSEVNWQPCKIYTYSILYHKWEYILSTAASDIKVDKSAHTGQTVGDIKSYRKTPVGTGYIVEAVPWYMAFSEDGGKTWKTSTPQMFQNLQKITGNGGTVGETMTYDIKKSPKTTKFDAEDFHSQELRSRVPKSEFDLSTWNPATNKTCSKTTANCYVVNTSGTFKFPMVFGNALKNGIDNTSSYKSSSSKTGDIILKTLKCSDGNSNSVNIKTPYIKDQYTGGTYTTELLWQDSKGVIDSVGVNVEEEIISGHNGYVTFSVNREQITQCNALIALKRNGTIVWSWHIWVTDFDLTTTGDVTYTYNSKKTTYKFMCKTLGQVDVGQRTETDLYEPRHCIIRVKQENSSKYLDYNVRQTSDKVINNIISPSSSVPYYEFGRKDPFQPSTGTENKFKSLYDIQGNTRTNTYYNTLNDGTINIAKNIENPTTFYYWSDNAGHTYSTDAPVNSTYTNLWSINLDGRINDYNSTDDKKLTSVATDKTVYDPCPVGFKIPNADAFRPLVATTTKTWENTANAGYKYWGVRYNNDDNLFFPSYGYYLCNNGKLDVVGSLGSYWNSNAALTGSNKFWGGNFFFEKTSDNKGTLSTSARCSSYTIRPIRELE